MSMDGSNRYQVSRTAHVNAPPARVYAIISDYHQGHPRILPPQFQNLVVEKGGRGAGTHISFQMKAFGRTMSFRHEVFEPEPGRVLVEQDRDNDSKTTFTIDPAPGGSSVTITSDLISRPGLAGKIERFLSKRFLLGVYDEEIRKLDALARS
jgi:hypothetical protein